MNKKVITYSEYIAESIGKNIEYSNYISEKWEEDEKERLEKVKFREERLNKLLSKK